MTAPLISVQEECYNSPGGKERYMGRKRFTAEQIINTLLDKDI